MSAPPPPTELAKEGGDQDINNDDPSSHSHPNADRGKGDPLDNDGRSYLPDNSNFDGVTQQQHQQQHQQQQSIGDMNQTEANDMLLRHPDDAYAYDGTAGISGSQQSYGSGGGGGGGEQGQQPSLDEQDGEGEGEDEEDAYEDPEEMIREFGRHPMMDRVQEALYNQLLQTYERVSEELRDKDADVKK